MIMRTVVQLHNRQRCGSIEPFCTTSHIVYLRPLPVDRASNCMHTMKTTILDDTAHGKSPTTPARGGRGYWHSSCLEGICRADGLGDRAPEIRTLAGPLGGRPLGGFHLRRKACHDDPAHRVFSGCHRDIRSNPGGTTIALDVCRLISYLSR